MKIFIDSADLAEIRRGAATGMVDGCTTNPSLLAKSGRPIEAVVPEICEIIDGPVSAEVISTGYDDMLVEARKLAKLHQHVVVKLPLTVDGLRAVRTLKREEIRTNVTLCFSANQALLAAKAGANYISPFVGRVDDTSHEGMVLVEQILAIYQNYGYETEVLAASVRHPVHVLDAAIAGAHCATMPLKVIEQLFHHPLTDVGLAKFIEDHHRAARAAQAQPH
ncbi:MAG: fructose-6-phosphate aldolase [Polyangiaceae bacterium]|nr:fructose-6-phosphate aldolase [Polyangiaceae bacterium]